MVPASQSELSIHAIHMHVKRLFCLFGLNLSRIWIITILIEIAPQNTLRLLYTEEKIAYFSQVMSQN